LAHNDIDWDIVDRANALSILHGYRRHGSRSITTKRRHSFYICLNSSAAA
jgi:hypothetical protein